MEFRRVNYENLKLGPNDKVSTSYIRLVENGTKLAHLAEQAKKVTEAEATSEDSVHAEKDFLATALENCQKFNEEFEGTFDK